MDRRDRIIVCCVIILATLSFMAMGWFLLENDMLESEDEDASDNDMIDSDEEDTTDNDMIESDDTVTSDDDRIGSDDMVTSDNDEVTSRRRSDSEMVFLRVNEMAVRFATAAAKYFEAKYPPLMPASEVWKLVEEMN